MRVNRSVALTPPSVDKNEKLIFKYLFNLLIDFRLEGIKLKYGLKLIK